MICMTAVSLVVAGCVALGACAATPLIPYSADTPPLVLAPASLVGVQDQRGRFREIYCAVLEAHGHALPDYRPCEDALTRVGTEPAGTGKPVDLGPSKRRLVAAVVPGIGYECFEPWLNPPGSVGQHVRQFGYDAVLLKVDALSSSENNARQIRDAIIAMPSDCRRAAPRARRLFEGHLRHTRGGGRVPGDPEPRGGGGQRRRRGRRVAASERRRAVPGRPTAVLSGCNLQPGRRRRRGKPSAGGPRSVARTESASPRVALLLARHVPAAGAESLRFSPRATKS